MKPWFEVKKVFQDDGVPLLHCLGDKCWECGTLIEARPKEDPNDIVEKYTAKAEYRMEFEQDRGTLQRNQHLAAAAFRFERSSVHEDTIIGDKVKLKMAFCLVVHLEAHFKKPAKVFSIGQVEKFDDIEGVEQSGYWFRPEEVPAGVPSMPVTFYRMKQSRLKHRTLGSAECLRNEQGKETFDVVSNVAVSNRPTSLRIESYLKSSRFNDMRAKCQKHEDDLKSKEGKERDERRRRDAAFGGDDAAAAALERERTARIQTSSRFQRVTPSTPLVTQASMPAPAVSSGGASRSRTPVHSPQMASASGCSGVVSEVPVIPRRARSRAVVPGPGDGDAARAASPARSERRASKGGDYAPSALSGGRKSRAPMPLLAVEAAAEGDAGDEAADELCGAWRSKTGKSFPSIESILAG